MTPEDRQSAVEDFHAFQETHSKLEYGPKVDVYAFAITMWEITTHLQPWGAVPRAELFKRVYDGV